MAKYMTKQRRMLLDFLEKHTDQTLSAHEIAAALSESGISVSGISVSAVYRNLAALEADGLVAKEASRDGNEALYRYIHPEHCRDELHLSCKKCGRTFHMEHEAAKAIEALLGKTGAFTLDKSETVLYGVCKNCR